MWNKQKHWILKEIFQIEARKMLLLKSLDYKDHRNLPKPTKCPFFLLVLCHLVTPKGQLAGVPSTWGSCPVSVPSWMTLECEAHLHSSYLILPGDLVCLKALFKIPSLLWRKGVFLGSPPNSLAHLHCLGDFCGLYNHGLGGQALTALEACGGSRAPCNELWNVMTSFSTSHC